MLAWSFTPTRKAWRPAGKEAVRDLFLMAAADVSLRALYKRLFCFLLLWGELLLKIADRQAYVSMLICCSL